MIVQACLNGSRPVDYHARLPLDAEAMARDGAESIGVGAAEVHLHPRDFARRESLSIATIGPTLRAMRQACPGSLIGVSTGAWIEADEHRTLAAIEGWDELPDYASVNLAEPDAPAVMELLQSRGVGIEAGLASIHDAERLVKLKNSVRVLRILIEIAEQDFIEGASVADAIATSLAHAEIRRPILLHGIDLTVWPFVRLAAERRWSTRVGLEDGRETVEGKIASGNSELVAAAVEIFRLSAGVS
jgi:uncharacterized protein (DUF849 family)